MNKRIFLLVLPVLAIMFVGLGPASAQQPTPAPQATPALAAPPAPTPQAAPALAAPAAPTPQAAPPAPAPQAAQKATPPPAPIPPPSGNTYPNVRIDVTITDQTGNGPAIKKTMSLVANRSGSVRSGVNVPMASTTFGAAGTGGVNTIPVTSYNYRTMGLNLDANNVYVSPAGLIHVQLSLEYNPIDEAAEKGAISATTPASFSNFSQSFTLELENGKSLLVAQTSDPVPSRNRTLSVDVKATIVK